MYVDGFILPVPKSKLKAYKKMASLGAKVWKDHGALQYMECQADDMKVDEKWMMAFPKMVKPKAGETIFFSYIIYKNKAHRDKVNKAVMKDKRMQSPPKDMPFDCKRMAYGGFKVLVSA